jgi:hypothetical protein
LKNRVIMLGKKGKIDKAGDRTNRLLEIQQRVLEKKRGGADPSYGQATAPAESPLRPGSKEISTGPAKREEETNVEARR